MIFFFAGVEELYETYLKECCVKPNKNLLMHYKLTRLNKVSIIWKKRRKTLTHH